MKEAPVVCDGVLSEWCGTDQALRLSSLFLHDGWSALNTSPSLMSANGT